MLLLFAKSHMKRTRGKGYKLYQERFHPGIRKKFFTVRAINHWNLPHMVEPPSLKAFKT